MVVHCICRLYCLLRDVLNPAFYNPLISSSASSCMSQENRESKGKLLHNYIHIVNTDKTCKIMIPPVTLVIGILLIINTALAQHDGCGERMRNPALMIGGQDSKIGMWPWQVGMYKINKASNWEFKCGGALIAPQWVLTAAHCFYIQKENSVKTWSEKDICSVHKYKIRAGDHEIMSFETNEQESIPLEILIHPGYKPNRTHENDIALIKLNRKFNMSRYVRTVCLPDTTEDLTKPGVTGSVAGWGMSEKEAPHSSILRHSTYNILNNSLCQRHRGSKNFLNETVTFCARDIKSRPCKGDSGGSMVRKVLVNGQHRWVTIGLVSWGGCTLESNYGYYTRVQPFMDWILLHKTTPCSDPGVPTHAVRFGNHFKHGQVVMFRCKKGYKLTGKPFIICNKGRWDKTTPNCSGPCSDPGIPSNGTRLDHSFHHNDVVRFSCDAGWNVEGKQTIICKNGRWDYNTPTCILAEAYVVRAPTPMTVHVGEDVVFMWNTANGIISVEWGLKLNPRSDSIGVTFIYANSSTPPTIDPGVASTDYKGRVSFVGNLTAGHAWFKITNVKVSDTNTYGVRLGHATFSSVELQITEVILSNKAPHSTSGVKLTLPSF